VIDFDERIDVQDDHRDRVVPGIEDMNWTEESPFIACWDTARWHADK
jgi:hypothetical protein